MASPDGAPRAVTGPPDPSTVTQDERYLAAAAYFSVLLGFWFVGPLVVYVLKRESSRFVAFHGLQALVSSVLQGVLGVVAVIGFALMPALVALASGGRSWVWALMALGVVLGLAALGLFVVHIIAGAKALDGKIWLAPVIGRLARRFGSPSPPDPTAPSPSPPDATAPSPPRAP